MILSYHNIIYYKTLFVKERLLNPFGHNDDFFGAIFPQKAEKAVFLPRKRQKRGGYARVTPSKGNLFLDGDADRAAGGLDLAEAALGGLGDVH